ncbi:hypothetical protein, partial [uncultured Abiotrophia sp.]|uniref:hypothetical protein n=1 Tax=uncultured Abiotrophia sp. TaxID=316094 RepID=UPI0028DAF90E
PCSQSIVPPIYGLALKIFGKLARFARFSMQPVHCSDYLWTGSRHFEETCAICSLLHAASPLFRLSMDWL